MAVILDAYSRRVIGWVLDYTLEDELTLTALRMALERRVPVPVLVHHSDRGVQYASQDYTNLLKGHGITISMFLSTFSGTHFLQPRTVMGRIGFVESNVSGTRLS